MLFYAMLCDCEWRWCVCRRVVWCKRVVWCVCRREPKRLQVHLHIHSHIHPCLNETQLFSDSPRPSQQRIEIPPECNGYFSGFKLPWRIIMMPHADPAFDRAPGQNNPHIAWHDAYRIDAWGTFLRKTRIDKINLSIVGLFCLTVLALEYLAFEYLAFGEL